MGLWEEIYKESFSIKQHNNLILGDGSIIKFWEDAQCSEEPFSMLFPMLYTMSGSKRASVKEVWRPVGELGGWDLWFEKHLIDWEMETVENLFNRIKDKKINPLEEDRMAWKLTKDGHFSLKSSFEFFEGERGTDLFPKRLFWNKWVPSKMGFFAWEAWWGRVLTMDQLKRRSFFLANRCPLCRKDEENIEHLFLYCPMV